jgi:hypothetical protein
VSSLSNICEGFQPISLPILPKCTAENRGTNYVEPPMSRKFVRLIAVLVLGLLAALVMAAVIPMLLNGWGGACVVAMVLSSLVAGAALGTVSNRLNRYVYFDAVLFGEAKAGSVIARVAILAHIVFLVSFFSFLWLKLYGAPV